MLLSRGMGSTGEAEGVRKGLASNVPGSGSGGAEQGFSVFYRCPRVLPGRGLGRPERSVTLDLEKVSFLGRRRRELPVCEAAGSPRLGSSWRLGSVGSVRPRGGGRGCPSAGQALLKGLDG